MATPTRERLTEKDNLGQILDWLGEATPKWEHLGFQLELKSHELEVIKMKYPHDPLMCLKEVMTKKLREGQLTWEDILKALRSDLICLNQLAKGIQNRITTEHGNREVASSTKLKGDESGLNKEIGKIHYSPVSQAISYRYLMKKHSSYYGISTGIEAEKMLKAKDEDCYLTRYSEQNKAYLLSVMKKSQSVGLHEFFHFKLLIDNEKESYEIEGYGKSFKNIDELFLYYQSNPITPKITSIGKQCLSKNAIETPMEMLLQNSLRRHTENIIEKMQQQLERNVQVIFSRLPPQSSPQLDPVVGVEPPPQPDPVVPPQPDLVVRVETPQPDPVNSQQQNQQRNRICQIL